MIIDVIINVDSYMTNSYLGKTPLVLMALMFTGCDVIGDIFSAGVYTGIFLVVAVIVAILFIVFRAGKKN